MSVGDGEKAILAEMATSDLVINIGRMAAQRAAQGANR